MDEANDQAEATPDIPCRPQPASDWTGPFPLPAFLADFYAAGGPTDVRIDIGYTVYSLTSLARLWAFQEHYRYGEDPSVPLEGWDPDLLVVALVNSDPYVVSMSTGRVLFGEHDSDPPFDFGEVADTLDGLLPDLRESMDDDMEREAERRRGEVLAGIRHVNFAEVSAACKGLPVPVGLKAAWVEHGYGMFGEGPRGPLRILSPAEVRAMHEADPASFEGGIPICRDRDGVLARVDGAGKIVLADGGKRGPVGSWLERLGMGRGP